MTRCTSGEDNEGNTQKKVDKFKIRKELSKNKQSSAERSAQIDSFPYEKEFIK